MQIEDLNIQISPENKKKWSELDLDKKLAYIKYAEAILNLLIARDEMITSEDVRLIERIGFLIDSLDAKIDDITMKVVALGNLKLQGSKQNPLYEKYMKYKTLFEESTHRNSKLKSLIKELGDIICRNRSCIKVNNEKEEIDIEHICEGKMVL